MSSTTMSRMRWYMLALVFAGTTLNYLDRIVLSFLAVDIRASLHFDAATYGYIMTAFSVAYMIGYIFAGRIVDRVGTRIGYALAVGFWSIAAAGHALVQGAMGLAIWRSLLGLVEAGNFPAALKAVAEWFPQKDRALANGLFNSGTNLASICGPILLVAINARFGWRAAFLFTGGLGFLLVVIWWMVYRHPSQQPRVNKAELDYIRGDGVEADNLPTPPWKAMFGYRETWGFTIAKFLTDPVWWFYLWWLPLYLGDMRKVSATQMGLMIPFVYIMASVGSVAAGWLSGSLIRRGWSAGKARKTAMAVCACLMPFSTLAIFAPTPWMAVCLVGLACALHQGWSANLFATTSDVFPSQAVGSVTGIGGSAGGLGGALFSSLIPGLVIQHFGYKPVFLAMGWFHLTALVVVYWLMGDLKRVELKPMPAAATGSATRS